MIGFGASNVALSGAVVGGLVIVVSCAGFASPLVVIARVGGGSLCCASGVAELHPPAAVRLCAFTFNSHGLGRTGGFLTGWIMVFALRTALSAGLSLTSCVRLTVGLPTRCT